MLSLLVIFACSVPPLLEPPPAALVEAGTDQGAGNIVGIQAWMDPTAYWSADRLDSRLRIWLDDADQQGWIQQGTVVVLPESIGTWLVVLGESGRVLEAPTAGRAFERIVRAHPSAFLEHRADAPVEDADRYAIFSMKAREMAEAYHQVMSTLAADYEITLVAGTIALPEPEVLGDELRVTPGGELYDVSLVYGPDGGVLAGPIEEVYPDSGELGLVTEGRLTRVEALTLPSGLQLGVLPGQDAWFPGTWDAVAFNATPWVVAPQYISPDQVWEEPWDGYDGWDEPVDVDPGDVRGISLAQADQLYGLPGRLDDQGLPGGLSVPLRGHLWDLGTDGVVRLGVGGAWTDGPHVDAPVVANLWLTSDGTAHR